MSEESEVLLIMNICLCTLCQILTSDRRYVHKTTQKQYYKGTESLPQTQIL